MAINSTNSLAIAFNKLSGKVHTQQNFAVTEEGISTNVQMSYSTVFANPIVNLPVTDSGLTALYSSNGIVQRVKFQIDIIPDTEIAVGKSQGYRLKLPADWNANGDLFPEFVAGNYLHTALGKLQIVPSLYGALKPDGSTEYDPILYQTNGSTVIAKFDPINWYFDPYSGIIFIQDPPTGYDSSAARPGFLEAFLYVGDYLDDVLGDNSTGNTGTTATNIGGAVGVFKDKVSDVLRFKSFVGLNGIAITGDTDNILVYYTGATGGSNVFASNGLTKVGNNITLGGLLTGNTNINATNYAFAINYASGVTIHNNGVGTNLNLISTESGGIITSASTNIDILAYQKLHVTAGSGSTILDMDQNRFSITGSTGWDLIWNRQNKRFIAGDNCQATGGSINYTFGDSNVNAGVFGSVIFGELSTIDANIGAAMAVGEGVWISAYGGKAFGRGTRVNSTGGFSIVGGGWIPGSTNPKTNHKVPQTGGFSSFGFYATDGGQTDNHGALGTYSAILGGTNHNIPSNSTSSAIIGGTAIKVASGVTNTVHLPKVRIGLGTGGSLTTNNANPNLLVVNSTTGEIEIRLSSTISGGTGSSTQNIYSAKRIVTGSTSMSGSDFVLFCNATTPITLTAPSSPVDGQVFKIKDASGTAETNNITINGNGKNIDGSSTVMINTNRGGIEMVYDQILDFWLVMNFIG